MKERQKIIAITKEFLSKITNEPTTLALEEEADGRLLLKIETNDPGILIGWRGQNISHLEILMRRVFFKQMGEKKAVSVDINNYRQKQVDFLRHLAADGAYRAVVLKKSIELKPMPAFERRAVHMLLGLRNDVFTESIGKGENRRVVINPA